jgi:uncharacterized membrane protein affecting hemolysin expression
MANGASAWQLAALVDQATQAQAAAQLLLDQCAAEITYLQGIAATAQPAPVTDPQPTG